MFGSSRQRNERRAENPTRENVPRCEAKRATTAAKRVTTEQPKQQQRQSQLRKLKPTYDSNLSENGTAEQQALTYMKRVESEPSYAE